MDGTPLAEWATAEPAVDGEARIGDVLDRRYRIDELIGEGGMAHVYRVTHTMIGKSLAAKVVRHELRNDEEVIRRFLREAQIVSSIKHPNVVDISDYGETPEGGAFCVMELLRGRTLADAVDQDGAFSPEAALGIALQICQGLNHSHETGVVHRDLKPQNIFICDPKNGKEPVVKLIDFGVARAGNRITVVGAVLGTPEYMSPEQVRGDHVDAGADLYALGVILFELLTAAVPYRSDDVAVTMQSHLHAPTPKMTQVDPGLAVLVQTQLLIERLMSKDRSQRPGTAAEAAVLLQQTMTEDLGSEATERVMRSTLAIGSGGIAQGPLVPPTPARPWSDRNMRWNPEPQTQPQEAAPVFATTEADPLSEPRPTRSLPWIMVATAMVVAGATVGGYAALGGFRPKRAPAPAPKVEIVSAPVPSAPEESQVQPTVAGGKSGSDEQTPPPEASVPAEATPDPPPREPEISESAANPPQSKTPPGSERSPRRPTSEKRKPNKPREKKHHPPAGTHKRPAGTKKPATASDPAQSSKPAATPEPTPPTPPPSPKQDGDLRNPFG